MNTFVLILVLIHYDGAHAISVPFAAKDECEAAAKTWRSKPITGLLRYVHAECHPTGAKR